MDYKGIKCPVCEKPFLEADDIVVCPICGAPYHRACYAEKGACIFTELHEKGRTWAPPPPPAAPDTASEIKDNECPACGTLNAHSALFCNVCGVSLSGAPEQHRNSAHTSAEGQRASYNTQSGFSEGTPAMGGFAGFPGMGMPFAFDPMGGTNPAEALDDSVTYGDASKFIQQNSAYYLSVFRNDKERRRNKFNFSAFLFSGGWLLYRKHYKAGILVTALMLLLYLGNTLVQLFVTQPLLLSVLDAYGFSAAEVTNAQLYSVINSYVMESPTEAMLLLLPLLFYVLMFAVMLFMGFRGNRMYKKHCVRSVQQIKRESHTQSDIDTAYLARGGVNPAVALCLLICYFVISWIPIFL